MIRKLSLLPIAIFFAVIYFLFIGLDKDPTLIPSPLIGKQLPEFNSKTLLDNSKITNNDLLEKTYILNVWGSWCYACSIEHNYFIDIKKKKSIDIYGLNYKDNRKSAVKWLKDKGNPYKKNIFDDSGNIAIELGVYGAPETFLVNEGIIIHKHIGPIDKNYYKEIVLPNIKNE